MNILQRFAGPQERVSGLPRFAAISLPGLGILLLSLALYLSTLTSVHTFDALSYALDVDTKPWQELFHPHHLAYGPLGALVLVLAHAFGWQGSAVVPMQVTNALAGALGVMLFFELVRATTRRLDLALCGVLLLGGSYTYWYYAVEVEVYTIAALFLIMSLWLLVKVMRAPTLRLCLILGLVQGMAVLFHQTNVLLCVPVTVALWLMPHPDASRYSLWMAYLLPLALVVAGSYLLVGFGVSGFHSWGEFMAWNTAYARTGWWGGAITGKKWVDLGRGLSSALAHPGGASLLLLLAGLVVAYLRHLLRGYRRLAMVLAAWLTAYGAFFFWWEPDNAEFWIASLPPAVLLLLLALAAGKPRWHPGIWLTLAAGLTMLVGNYQAIVLRGSGAHTPQRSIAHALAQQSAPGAFLLVPDGLQELYLRYYEGRTAVMSLSQVLHDTSGDWDATCARLRGRIEAALSSGAAVWIGDEVLQPALIDAQRSDPLLERFQLQQEQVAACFAGYQPDMVPVAPGAGLPTYYRLPSAQEMLAGSGWQFARARWGWQTHNARAERFEFYDTGPVWSFIPLDDPYVVSPRMVIDTSRYWAIQVRLGKGVSNREAQIFFMDETGIIEESRSVRWELANHADLKTYHLDLRDHPAWTGTLAGLRLDPSTGPDQDEGERIFIAGLRLLSYADDPPED